MGRRRSLVDRIRRNPRRRCTLDSLLNTNNASNKASQEQQQRQQQEHSPAVVKVKKRLVVPREEEKSPAPIAEPAEALMSEDDEDALEQPEASCLMGFFRTSSTSSLLGSGNKRKRKFAELTRTVEDLKNQVTNLRKELHRTTCENKTLQSSIQAQIVARNTLHGHTEWLQRRLKVQESKESLYERCCMANADAESFRLRDAATKEALSSVQEALARSESVRRSLHESNMTMRGNMRVFCRLRPSNSGSRNSSFDVVDGQEGGACKCLRVCSPESLSVDGLSTNRKSWEFSFDRIFKPSSTQESVFQEVEGLIQSVLDGFNVCIFAYGQTGSGKTYTMGMGGPDDNVLPTGICPRALTQLLKACHQQNTSLEMSYVELYNEELRDLLPVTPRLKSRKKLVIRHQQNNTEIQGLNKIPLRGIEHAKRLIAKAQANRSIGKTKMNDRSSRSHSVLSIHVYRHGKVSVLHLVDLAGSERLAQSGSDSSRVALKEQCAINSSLSALRKTLESLHLNKEAAQQQHVPYRDSKLTYLLQNALQSESSKTLMICTVSQDDLHVSESINSLRFAQNVLIM